MRWLLSRRSERLWAARESEMSSSLTWKNVRGARLRNHRRRGLKSDIDNVGAFAWAGVDHGRWLRAHSAVPPAGGNHAKRREQGEGKGRPLLTKAVITYEQTIDQCGLQKNENKILASLKNILAFDYNEAKESFARIAATKLTLFSTPNQQFLLSNYLAFAESPHLPLRKYASKYSADLALSLNEFEGPILKIVEILFKDKEESNKIYLIDTIIALSRFVLGPLYRKTQPSCRHTST